MVSKNILFTHLELFLFLIRCVIYVSSCEKVHCHGLTSNVLSGLGPLLLIKHPWACWTLLDLDPWSQPVTMANGKVNLYLYKQIQEESNRNCAYALIYCLCTLMEIFFLVERSITYTCLIVAANNMEHITWRKQNGNKKLYANSFVINPKELPLIKIKKRAKAQYCFPQLVASFNREFFRINSSEAISSFLLRLVWTFLQPIWTLEIDKKLHLPDIFILRRSR